MRTFLVVMLVVCASTAHAGVKAEMLCGVFADGAIKSPLPDKAKPKLEGKIACALHLSDTKPDNGSDAKIYTVRYVVDPTTKKTTKVTTMGVQGSVENMPGSAAKDLSAYFEANTKDSHGEIPFQSCETFEVIGIVGNSEGTLFKKVVKIEQSCPKPKAIKIDVACEAKGTSGSLKLPTKNKAGLADYDVIACKVTSKDKTTGTVKVLGTSSWTGYATGKPATQTAKSAGSGAAGAWEVKFTRPTEWETCVDVKLDFAVSSDGTSIATKQIKIAQDCGGGD